MRKTQVTLHEGHIEFLMDALRFYYEGKSKEDKKLADMKYEETKFNAVDNILHKAMMRCCKKPEDTLYAITGGYLGEGIYVTEDGRLYEN